MTDLPAGWSVLWVAIVTNEPAEHGLPSSSATCSGPTPELALAAAVEECEARAMGKPMTLQLAMREAAHSYRNGPNPLLQALGLVRQPIARRI